MDYPKSVANVGLVNGKFVDEDAGQGTVGSLIPSAWGNAITDEVLNVLRAAGLEPDESRLDQLMTAIPLLCPGRLVRTSVYTKPAGVQMVSVDGGAPTAADANTFTPLPTTRFVEVEAQGGGGGGGGTSATGPGQVSVSGAGGAGAYALGRFSSGFESVVVTVGVGGAGGAIGNNNGANGGTTSFGALLSAPGGVGGGGQAAVTPPASRGGSSVSSAPVGGYVGYPGAAGSGGMSVTTTVFSLALGASSRFGGGNPGYGTGFGNATGYGTGGGGSGVSQSSAGLKGGDGAPGILIVREYE